MDKLPSFLDKRIFGLILEIGEIGKLTEEDLMSYEASLKHKRDAESVFNSALNAGREEGRKVGLKEGLEEGRKVGLEEGKHEKAIEFARIMKQDGASIAQIMRYTDLSAEEIENFNHIVRYNF